MLSFILSFISFIPFFITYKFIQSYSFSEIKRERERVREKNLEGGRTAGGGGSNKADEHRSPAQRQRRRRQSDELNADDRSTVYDVDVDLR